VKMLLKCAMLISNYLGNIIHPCPRQVMSHQQFIGVEHNRDNKKELVFVIIENFKAI